MANIPAGQQIPNDFNAIIEIPTDCGAIKYEVDKDSGLLMVDRFMTTSMRYPCNYGYVPSTLADDGDPVDVLVITPHPVVAGSLVRVRPIGILQMTDEAGKDAKILAVPIEKVCRQMAPIKSLKDVSPLLLDSLIHFFEHYKDLEPNKWVKIDGWADKTAAEKELQEGIARYPQENTD